MKNGEYPRQSINWKRVVWQKKCVGVCFQKGCGQVEWVLGMFFLLFLAVLLCTQLQLELYRTSSAYMEDALAASNLASAVVDLKEYGISRTIQIAEPVEAYHRFCEALKGNLGLDDNWMNYDSGVISGAVSVEAYIIYNVKGDMVTMFQVETNGLVHKQQGKLGAVQAPNGILVEGTGVYSEISFPVKGLFGMENNAHKGKLVDIVTNGEE